MEVIEAGIELTRKEAIYSTFDDDTWALLDIPPEQLAERVLRKKGRRSGYTVPPF